MRSPISLETIGISIVNLSLPVTLWYLRWIFPLLLTKMGMFYTILTVIGLYITRQYLRGSQCYLMDRADGHHVLITGANSGIGYSLAKHLIQRGAHVHLVCRNRSRGEDAILKLTQLGCDKANMTLHLCDLTNLSDVCEFAKRFTKEVGTIDILVCNAGLLGPTRFARTMDGHEITYQTNYLAHYLLTQKLLPIISTNGRVVNISSVMHKFGDIVDYEEVNSSNRYLGIVAYNRSKLAQVMISREIAPELPNGIKIISCHPGNVYSNILQAGPLAFLDFTWVKLLIAFVLKTVDDGAQTPLFTCLIPNLVSGGYYRECRLDKNVNPLVNNNAERRALLYQTQKALQPFL